MRIPPVVPIDPIYWEHGKASGTRCQDRLRDIHGWQLGINLSQYSRFL